MLGKAWVYAIPGFSTAIIIAPVTQVLGGYYAKNCGLALTTIASVILIARVFDAITDPLIGYYSDWWRLRVGSRKPFIMIGAVLLMPSSYFLFVPPEGAGAAGKK